MKYLLDTCALIRLIDSPDDLPSAALSQLRQDGSALMGLSAMSLWEVARKESLGNLELALPVKVWLRTIVNNPGLEVMPLTDDVAWESCHLPDEFHRDPADRIIVATARIHHLIVVTSDKRIVDYPHVDSLGI